jgi:hypothetical protein
LFDTPAATLRNAWPGLVAGPAALALYALSLPQGLTWAHNGVDGGDLLAAALSGGVPHPPGYPTYQLLLRFAIAVYPGEPARAGAWLSAICAAVAVALLTDLARRVALTRLQERAQLAAVAALVAGLAWAVSPILWGQASIVEVYALNALFCVALLWLLWRWAEAVGAGRSGARWLALGGLVFGLGMGNHLTLGLILPGALFWMWRTGRGSPGISRGLALAALATFAGLLVYAYLPLAASERPAINWGDPLTVDRFLWVVTGRLYSALAFGLPLSELPARLSGWATLAASQFLPWGLALSLIGLWQLDRRLRAWWATTLLIWLAFTVYAIGYNSADSDAYLLPALAIMALWLAEGVTTLLERVRGPWPLAAIAAVLLLLAMVAVPAFVRYWQEEYRSPHLEADAFWRTALARAEPNAVILTASDKRTFALWYAVYGLEERSDVAVVNASLYGFDWYRRTLAERHPHLLPSVDTAPPLEALVPDWLAERPVYAAEDVGLPLRLGEETPANVLSRVVGLTN